MLELEEAPQEDKLWNVFKESVATSGGEGEHIPLKGDARFHFALERAPNYQVGGYTDSIRVLTKAFQFAKMSSAGDTLLSWKGIDDDSIVAAHVKKPFVISEDPPEDGAYRVFVDVDFTPLKNLWGRMLPPCPEDIGTIRTIDDLIRHPKFQLACQMADIEKVETANVVVDLTSFKSLAKPRNLENAADSPAPSVS